MERSTLKAILESLETFRIEKTTSVNDTEKYCQAICAFSNDMPDSKKPGYLILGINEDGTPSGIKANDKLLKDLAGLRTDGNILPIPAMTVEHIPTEEGDIIVITVQPSPDPPVRYRGRCYIRIGPRKDIATQAEEDQLAERRQYSYRTFDMQPCREARLEDINIELFTNHYLSKAIDADTLREDTREVVEQMSSLRLYDRTYGCPTNAAVILFGKNPQFFSQEPIFSMFSSMVTVMLTIL